MVAHGRDAEAGGDRRDNHLIAKLGYAVVIELGR
jgi:hypothetical protein